MIKDEGHVVADSLGATRSPEVFLLDAQREIVYRGRIDDQYSPGIHGRAAPTRRDLEEAIVASLESRPIAVAETEPVGCYLDLAADHVSSEVVTYATDIAPIFDAHCARCHRPGEAAPFSLLTFEDALAWRDTIRQVVDERRMPPWGVVGGHFVNDPSLDEHERATILAWLGAGCPPGNPADRPAPPRFSGDWSIRPDRELTMPAAFVVPKEGVLDYQQFTIDPKFSQDMWIQAVEIRPGNRSVVHHVNVYAKPKRARADELFINNLGDYYLAMAVPGNTITAFPEGTAKLIPAGWNIVLEVHYVPNGTEQVDRTSLALTLADRSAVRKQMATRAILDDGLVIGPREKKIVAHTWVLDDDYTLFALYPHMHLRGRSMVFEALYSDGRREELLNVAEYDFAWQYRYVLATPKNLPRGTTITATAEKSPQR
jgi:mono/diheme cytochrome c family protein